MGAKEKTELINNDHTSLKHTLFFNYISIPLKFYSSYIDDFLKLEIPN